MTAGLSEDRTELVVSRDELLQLEARATGADAELLAPTARAVSAPRLTAEILRIRGGVETTADLWIDEERTVLQVRSDAPAPVTSVSRDLTPQLLARALDVGPRPRSSAAPFSASIDEVVAGLESDAPPWGDAVPEATLWRLTWAEGSPEEGRVSVLDLGGLGYRRPEPIDGSDAFDWVPTDPSEVWQGLGSFFALLLPG
jgi:hypothetical protein